MLFEAHPEKVKYKGSSLLAGERGHVALFQMETQVWSSGARTGLGSSLGSWVRKGWGRTLE